MITCKPCVDFGDLAPQMVLFVTVADQVFVEYGLNVCQINAIKDGVHSKTSLHYAGRAVDLDTHNNGVSKFPGNINITNIANEIRQRLGDKHFDVIFHNNHIHGEYQPRR